MIVNLSNNIIAIGLPDVMIRTQVVETFLEKLVQIAAKVSGKQLFGRQFRNLIFQVIDFRLEKKKFGPENVLRFRDTLPLQEDVIHLRSGEKYQF